MHVTLVVVVFMARFTFKKKTVSYCFQLQVVKFNFGEPLFKAKLVTYCYHCPISLEMDNVLFSLLS